MSERLRPVLEFIIVMALMLIGALSDEVMALLTVLAVSVWLSSGGGKS